MKYHVTLDGRTVTVDLSGPDPVVDGRPLRATLATRPGTSVRHLLLDDRSYPLVAVPADSRGRWRLLLSGRTLEASAIDERTRSIRELSGATTTDGDRVIAAPMPGLVLRINVEVGEQIEAGQGIVVVEAMKMENELRAPTAGRVARIDVAAGQAVEKGTVLVVLEQPGG
jgi:biotin carboxyl carrier protein